MRAVLNMDPGTVYLIIGQIIALVLLITSEALGMSSLSYNSILDVVLDAIRRIANLESKQT